MAGPDLSRLCAIAVMAKAPQPGRVKTRLQGVLTPEEAAQMGAAFLSDTTANLMGAERLAPVHGYVAYAPAGTERVFDGLLAPGTRLVLADGQQGAAPDGVDGFGRALWGAVRALFELGYGAVGVLNADGPTLPTAFLCRAAELLVADVSTGGAPAVLGPAEDGGYYFLGLRSPDPRPFSRVRWSTDVVAAETRERLAEAGIAVAELPAWYDVDDPPALRRLLAGDEDGGVMPFAAPATHALMARLGLTSRLAGLLAESAR